MTSRSLFSLAMVAVLGMGTLPLRQADAGRGDWRFAWIGPDLYVSDCWVVEGRAGSWLKITVSNKGFKASAPCKLEIQIGTDGIPSSFVSYFRDIPSLGTLTNSSYTVSTLLPTGANISIWMCVDPFGVVSEMNEYNNCKHYLHNKLW